MINIIVYTFCVIAAVTTAIAAYINFCDENYGMMACFITMAISNSVTAISYGIKMK